MGLVFGERKEECFGYLGIGFCLKGKGGNKTVAFYLFFYAFS